jgi:hypothetical protein
MVEDDKVGTGFGASGSNLLDLALARIRGRVRALPAAGERANDGRAGRHSQRVELGHALGWIGIAEIERDQERAIATLRALKH